MKSIYFFLTLFSVILVIATSSNTSIQNKPLVNEEMEVCQVDESDDAVLMQFKSKSMLRSNSGKSISSSSAKANRAERQLLSTRISSSATETNICDESDMDIEEGLIGSKKTCCSKFIGLCTSKCKKGTYCGSGKCKKYCIKDDYVCCTNNPKLACPKEYPVCPLDRDACDYCCKEGYQCMPAKGKKAAGCEKCAVEMGITEITKIEYCTDDSRKVCSETLDSSITSNMVTTAAAAAFKLDGECINHGAIQNICGTITPSFTMTQTTTFTHTDSVSFKEGYKFSSEVKIPLIQKGESEISFESTQGWSDTETKTTTYATTFSFDPGNKYIAPYTRQKYYFEADAMSIKIPFVATAIMEYSCGETGEVFFNGEVETSGIQSFALGSYKDILGESVPVECTGDGSVDPDTGYKQFCVDVTDTCTSNPICQRYGIIKEEDKCCPDLNGEYSSCCAASQAHPACHEQFDQQICPSKNGQIPACCDAIY